MKSARLVVAAALTALSVVAAPRIARAQGTATIDVPRDVPFPAAPLITVRASGFPGPPSARMIRLRLALDELFGLVLYDSTKAGDVATFSMIKLLPENRDIFVEAFVLDTNGIPIHRVFQLAGHTGPHLQLISPSALSGVTFLNRRPTFRWRSAVVTTPPGPWLYELSIIETATLVTRTFNVATDTVFTVPVDLEASTPYRWKVIARLFNGLAIDSAVAVGNSTFTIQPSDAVVKTLLYQNFPNPFPAPSSQSTCFWFDLKTSGKVELTIHDLRGHRVRTMIPGQLPGDLVAGRYGRASELDGTGCDPRLQWDGTADDGRVVPPGVYLLRFKADGVAETMKKILFRGQ
ncbi:MAG: hypothetical protein JWL61_3045 [Gemmatimonadetes bacterium]|nr:hypothetical protein [Gemmatimonadota bacterium]